MATQLSRVCAVMLVSLGATVSVASGQTGPADPIRVQVGEAATARGGLLEHTLVLASRDTARIERELASAVGGRDWVRVTSTDPEVAVALRRTSRTQSSRSFSKDRKKVSVSFVYTASADIGVRGEHAQLDARVTDSRTYAVNASRQEPTEYEDREAFDRAARDVGTKARAWILERLVLLRPGGPDAGVRHRIRHKLAVVPDGLEVMEVVAGSAAERAGLRPGDRIRRVGLEGGTVDMDERVRVWRLLPSATSVTLEIECDGARRTLTLVLP